MAKDNYDRAIEIVSNVLSDVPFVLIGAQAVNSWMDDDARVRATLDIDFLVDAEESASIEFCQKFRDAGYTAHLRMGRITDEVPLYVRLVSESLPQVDLLFALRPLEKMVVENGKRIEDVNFKIAAPEDLIVLKVMAGRDTDALDIKNLLSHSFVDVDLKKVRNELLKINAAFLDRLEKMVK